jgi:hypothetical protein
MFYVGLLMRALSFIYSKNIKVRIGENNDACAECMKSTSLLDGLEYCFQTNENVTLVLSDFEYHIKAEEIAEYLMNSSNRSLKFKTLWEEKKKKKSILSLEEGMDQTLQKFFYPTHQKDKRAGARFASWKGYW